MPTSVGGDGDNHFDARHLQRAPVPRPLGKSSVQAEQMRLKPDTRLANLLPKLGWAGQAGRRPSLSTLSAALTAHLAASVLGLQRSTP